MKWYEDIDKFSSDERIVLSILTLNEDPTKIWIDYNDAMKMSTLRLDLFNMAVQTLISKGVVRMGNQGKGLTLALEEKIEDFKYAKLEEVLGEIEDEIQDALDKEDYDLASDLQKIVNSKKK